MKKGWEYKKIKEVADVIGGSTPKTNVEEYWGGDNYWVTPAELNGSKYIDKTVRCITSKAVEKTNLTLMPSGTVLLSSRAPIGKVCITKAPMYCNQGFKNLVCKELLYNEFAYYYLKHNVDFLQSLGTGATFKEISKKVVENVTIPIPPFSEQQHIVKELDLLGSIIEKKKAQLNELDNLAQSLFYEMFGDPITNDKGWEVKTMNEVCNEIGDGLHGTPQYDPNGSIAFINGNNLIDGKITITDRTQYVNETEAKKIFIKMDSNTVLLSINGTLGKTAIYNNENVVLGKSACYLRLSNQLTAFYVMALMNTHTFKDFLESNSSKSTIKNVGLKAIRNYKVILPSLALQQQFASKIEAIEHQKELIKQSIKEVETLFNSRMDYYFN